MSVHVCTRASRASERKFPTHQPLPRKRVRSHPSVRFLPAPHTTVVCMCGYNPVHLFCIAPLLVLLCPHLFSLHSSDSSRSIELLIISYDSNPFLYALQHRMNTGRQNASVYATSRHEIARSNQPGLAHHALVRCMVTITIAS